MIILIFCKIKSIVKLNKHNFLIIINFFHTTAQTKYSLTFIKLVLHEDKAYSFESCLTYYSYNEVNTTYNFSQDH
jgi:hypothetical protein